MWEPACLSSLLSCRHHHRAASKRFICFQIHACIWWEVFSWHPTKSFFFFFFSLLPHANIFRTRSTGKNSNKAEAPCFSLVTFLVSDVFVTVWPLSPGGHHAVSGPFFLLSQGLQQPWFLAVWGGSLVKNVRAVIFSPLNPVGCRAGGCWLHLPLLLWGSALLHAQLSRETTKHV